jgi:RNA polymerase sigma-70 factor (ECF subfamily)
MVFLLHRFEGLSYSEIARRLGVSRSAVEKHMMHALQMLSERFPD